MCREYLLDGGSKVVTEEEGWDFCMNYGSALDWLGGPADVLLETQSRIRRHEHSVAQGSSPPSGDLAPGMERVITTKTIRSSRKISDSFDGP